MTGQLPNIPRLFTGLAEALACLTMLLNLPAAARLKWWIPRVIGLAALQVAAQLLVGSWPLKLWVPGMLLNVGVMLATITGCTKPGWTRRLYLTCKALILAEFMASLGWQLVGEVIINLRHAYGTSAHSASIWWWSTPLMVAVFTACTGVYSLFHHRYTRRTAVEDPTQTYGRPALISAAITTLIVFAVSNTGFLLAGTTFELGDSFSNFIFRTMIDLAGLLLIELQEQQRNEHHLQAELAAINRTIQTQYDQYKAYQQANETIRRQFHDLKHQLAVIMSEDSAELRQQYLADMTQAINTYSATIETGNQVLDTVLTQKNAAAIAQQVSLTCLVDGKQLDFMSAMDIASLFGNAVDNAVESAAKIAQADRRLVELRVSRKLNFLVITVQNTFAQPTTPLEFRDGLPRTTKADKTMHGYGLKNIRYTIEKYRGTLTVDTAQGWFVLKAMIPLTDRGGRA